jgi:hypothetical protein
LCADSIFARSGVRNIFTRSSGAPVPPAFQVSYIVKKKAIGGVKINHSGSNKVNLIKSLAISCHRLEHLVKWLSNEAYLASLQLDHIPNRNR